MGSVAIVVRINVSKTSADKTPGIIPKNLSTNLFFLIFELRLEYEGRARKNFIKSLLSKSSVIIAIRKNPIAFENPWGMPNESERNFETKE